MKRLLFEVGTVDAEPADRFIPQAHELSDAFDELDGRSGVGRDEMVQLEFMFLRLLDHSRHGIPNLERRIAESPIDFVRLLTLVFKRDDGGEDPTDWQIEESEKRRELATSSYRLLQRTSLIPGMDSEGTVDAETLQRWVFEARRLCAAYGRTGIGDEKIGQLLSRAPDDNDGIRPSPAVSEVLEAVGSPDIRSGFAIGILNGRGVVTRAIGEGGAQERELAAQYRTWAKKRSPKFPFIAGILDSIAAEYERQGQRENEQAQVGQRLEY